MKAINKLKGISALTAIAIGASVSFSAMPSAAWAEKVLNIAPMGEPASMDPHYVSGTWENNIVGEMFLGLMTEDPKAEPILGAAESYNVSNDGRVYTFKIRDHKWSDGTPVTAADFEFSFQRLLDPASATEYAYLMYIIKNGEEVNTGKAKPEELAVKAIDDKTLEITLNEPAPYFLAALTHYTAYPVPKHVVEKHGKDWSKPDNIVVNGPYTLASWVPNATVKLVKNPEYFDKESLDLDTLVFHTQEDRVAIQKRFRAGEIDVARDFASDQIGWLQENLPAETKIAPYLGIYYYPMNTQIEPFNDIRVRKALSMAINREAIVNKVLKTGEIAAYSFVPPGIGNYDEPSYVSWKGMSYKERLDKAKELLAEAGFTKDNPLKFTLRYNTSENHKRVAIAAAGMWKQIGVEAELFNAEVKVHYADLKQADFQIARAAWIGDYNDPQNFLSLLEKRTGANNYGRYDNDKFNQLMMDAEKEGDIKKRAEIMAKAEAIAMEDQPIIPIYYYVSKNLVSQKVDGWVDNAQDIHRWRYISIKE
ncbi:peptide ABC transporter substrate-binding protein [Aestuariispira insulae]|uniref:Oligopeptide transport system substrate-binding protein n=1 Tax=Aestuariispira insulae TaxID=1461337 RepID=A0A3D9HWT4_9PROT|nr:peptide ABC transporter substrate-binding protein [Aestuariispira insulae]RED53964.1 oligopeptide transport system substrate-binding protein [Aestuariispira insulae]